MAGRSSEGLLRHVHRIVDLVAVGTPSDAQLLDWFVSRSGEAAEAASEELMYRHGPMPSLQAWARRDAPGVWGTRLPLPVIIVIDRAGKIAYRSDTAPGDHNLPDVFTRILQDPRSMTEQEVIEQVEGTLAAKIEEILKTD